MGCVVRILGGLVLLLALAVGARRVLERPAPTPPPGEGERDTTVDGVRWRSREAAGSGHETVVFVHGFLSSSATWKKVLESAAAGRRAVAVDLPGFGLSDRPWPFDYTVPAEALALWRYLDARDIDRVTLVGNSLGGAICLVAAAARPHRVVRLVLVDSASPQGRIPLGFFGLRTPLVGEVQIELLTRPVMALALRQRLYARADRVTEKTVDDWWEPIRVPGTRRAALAGIRSSRRGYEQLLSAIEAPTLVVWGEKDHLLPVRDGESLAAGIRGARLEVIAGAGHLPQEETPEPFARVVKRFLEQEVRALSDR
jgi:pimeloyl-ACP methyl ester carboxylesterase